MEDMAGIEDPFRAMPEVDGVNFEWLLEGMDPLEQACRRLEISAHEKGWDQRPEYYSFVHLPGPGECEHGDAAYVHGLGVLEIPMPEPCYTDPGSGLLTFINFMAGMQEEGNDGKRQLALALNALVPADFYGFALLNEAWTLPQSVPLAERMEASREHTMHEHPDRQEMRVLTVATVDGRIASVTRIRGEVPEFTEFDLIDKPLDGRIPTALRLMTSLFEEFDTWRNKLLEGSQTPTED
jgi:hypothetical protein